jgi:hypothetical protein
VIPAKESGLVHELGGNTLACSSGFEEFAAGVRPATGPQEIRITLTCNGGLGGVVVAPHHAPEVGGHPVLETSWPRPSAQWKITLLPGELVAGRRAPRLLRPFLHRSSLEIVNNLLLTPF